MIVQMKKVSLVLLSREKETALKTLRKAGLVHLQNIEGKGEKFAALKNTSAKLGNAQAILTELKVDQKKLQVPTVSNEDVLKTAERVIALAERKKTLLDKISSSAVELERLAPWGIVNPADLEYLSSKGIYLSLYEIPSDKYRLIGEDVKTLLVNTSKSGKRFLLVSDTEMGRSERPAGLPPEAYQVVLPEKSSDEIAEDIVSAKEEIAKIEAELVQSAVYIKPIADYEKSLQKEIEFEAVYSGMEKDAEENNASLSWLTGFVPVDGVADIKKTASENNWALLCEDPTEEDPVPTKLKNNKLVSLIYPLTDFLDVTPGYNEFDISSWFLLFFCVFFAMIFGDTGYGALIALLGIILMGKAKPGAKSLPALVTLLGASTMVWGILTCSYFGVDTAMLPPVLVDISSGLFSKAKIAATQGLDIGTAEDLANKNQQIFCFVLALIQLSVAHITCFFANAKKGNLKAVGDFGSLLQLWGTFYVVLSMVVADGVFYKFPLMPTPDGEPVRLFGWMAPNNFPLIALGVLAVGFLLNFCFSNYEGSIGKSILESLKNIISVLLGIVNVFSDIVSYIRLWAVALAGAAISNTVNVMAGPMFGKLAMFIFAIILLVFGHGLNMILNVLSVIVHGVRLNTLEFSQHLGMAWSGTKYKPFSINN